MTTRALDNQDDLRRGWCPTGSRAMDTADGDLLRIRPPGTRLTANNLAVLAHIAETHADGHVLLTRRAKLELRGIRDTASAVEALTQADLLEDAAQATLPDRIVSPATDLDATADANINALTPAIDAALVASGVGPSLPDKFALAIDGGGHSHISDFEADLRIDALPDAPGNWRIALAGDLDTATTLGVVPEAQAAETVRAILEHFVSLNEPARRMRDLPTTALQAHFQDCLPPVAQAVESPPARPAASSVPGVYDDWLIAGFAFGRITSTALLELAALARMTATGTIRITTKRSLVLGRTDRDARDSLYQLDAILAPTDARHPLVACVGRSGCHHGTTDTRDDALRYARAMPHLRAAAEGSVIHVSGCAKGCARRAAALITLVAANGRYDVIFNAGPEGQSAWHDLAPEAVAQHLAQLDQAFATQARDGESASDFLARLSQAELHHLLHKEATQ